MKNIVKVLLIVFLANFVNTPIVFTKTKNELVNRFAEILKFNSTEENRNYSKLETKITALFVRSTEKNSIDLTMLITYDKNITLATRKLLEDKTTPLIFSVSTMPFVETEFDPACFKFEQNDYCWSPQIDKINLDVFPLGDEAIFGGEINESKIHQGVLLLPGNFDIKKPIKVSYKNFKKNCRFR